MDNKEIKKILKSFFEDKYRGAANIKISSIKRIASEEGTSLYSFNLKCKYKHEPYNLNFLIRFYLDDNSLQKANEEHKVLLKLYKENYHVPKIYYFEKKSNYFHHPFIVMEKLESQPITSELHLEKNEEIEELILLHHKLLFNLRNTS